MDGRELLRDIVASDRLIVVTGAGISAGARLARDPTLLVPGWPGLLADLRVLRMASRFPLDAAISDDIELLLSQPQPPGHHLIEAASLLAAGWPGFDAAIVDAVRPAPDSEQPDDVRADLDAIHSAILGTQPRGIVTLNYDDLHERALDRRGTPWPRIVPGGSGDEDTQMVEAITARLQEPFLLKAHGDVNGDAPLVLSYESYRTLLGKHPAYRAFVQFLMTNFSFVFVGFGMSDPDFDLFFDTIAVQFGSPVQRHVLLTKRPAPADEAAESASLAAMRRRYGVHAVQVDEWAELPSVLRDATQTPGPRLQATIGRATSARIDQRREAHRDLRLLGPAGRSVAIEVLAGRIDRGEYADQTELSELIYSLGCFDSPPSSEGRIRETLFDVIRHSSDIEAVAHAVDRLERLAGVDDLPELEARLATILAAPLSPGSHNELDGRVPVYLKRLILRIKASALSALDGRRHARRFSA